VIIRLQVSNTEGIVALVEDNAIDLGVVEGPVANKSLVVEVCRIDRLVAVLPPEHALAGSVNLPVADVLKYPFIAREEGSGSAARSPSRGLSRRAWGSPFFRAAPSTRSCSSGP
jgi:DNA-binding transcriptional LysR family regulator